MLAATGQTPLQGGRKIRSSVEPDTTIPKAWVIKVRFLTASSQIATVPCQVEGSTVKPCIGYIKGWAARMVT